MKELERIFAIANNASAAIVGESRRPLVIYTIERAKLLADQFRRFKSIHAHHLAGLFSNIDFWLHEVEEAYGALDGYGQRFSKIRDAQASWVEQFDVREYSFCPICRGPCEFDDGSPPPPRRTSASELEGVRVELREEAREFLIRCFRTGLMGEKDLRSMCARIGSGIEPSELRR